MSPEQKLARYLVLARRAVRHWLIGAGIFVLVTGIAVGVAMMRPRYYRSECLIYFKEEMRKDILSEQEANRERNLAHKLHQLLWSRTRLMQVIREFDLYPKLRAAKTEAEVVETMRNAIQVREKGGDTFWVSYEGKDPATVQKVTQRLAETFVEENAREAVERSRATTQFIEKEAAKAKDELGAATAALARFYELHPELVPDPTQAVGGPGAAVRAIGKAARASSRRPRYHLRGASPELRALLAEKGRLEARLSLAQRPRNAAGLAEREQELAAARRKLASLRSRFAEAYPDVQRARSRVHQLERQVSLQRKYGASTPEATRLREEIGQLDRQINRLAAKRRASARDGEKAARRVAQAPETPDVVETEYSSLMQRYEVAKARTAALADKQLTASVLSSFEATQEQATFRIVDPAFLPEKSIRPSRRKIAMAGAFLGFLLALAAMAARVLLDSRIHDETDLLGVTDLPVLARVPHPDHKAGA